MESYLPNVPFDQQYPAWAEWHPSQLKTLGDQKRFTEGCLLFVDGGVRELVPESTDSRFEATVQADKAYGVNVWIGADNAPAWRCGCIEHHDERPCVHSFAALAAMMYLFRGHNYVPLAPMQANINHLAAGIDGSRTKNTSTLTRLRIMRQEGRELSIRADAKLPEPLVHRVNPYATRYEKSRYSLDLPDFALWTAMLELHDYARKNGIGLDVEVGPGRIIAVEEDIKQLTVRPAFDYQPASGHIVSDIIPRVSDAAPPVMHFGTDGALLDDGHLAAIGAEDAILLTQQLTPPASFTTEARDGSEHADPAEFNAAVCALPLEAQRKLAEARLSFGGAPLDADLQNLPEAELEVALELLSISRHNKTLYAARLHAHADGSEVDLDLLVRTFKNMAVEAAEGSRLLGSKVRVDRLLRLLAHLPLVSAEERQALTDHLLEGKHFEDQAVHTAATCFLDIMADAFYQSESGEALPLLLAAADGNAEWKRVRVPQAGLIQLIATLHRLVPIHTLTDLSRGPVLEIPASLEGVGELATVCQTNGFAVHIDDSPLHSEAVDIQIDVDSDEKLDWFEVKAEIRCGEATIPREQWTQLIRGELLVQTGGTVTLPRLNQAEAMERLMEMFPQPRGGKGTEELSQLNRLQMLDWIALRRQGASVRLPKEAEQLFRRLLNFTEIPKKKIPKAIQAKLRSYQHRGFEWLAFLYEHRFGACLADDMGLGKTLQAIAFLAFARGRRGQRRQCLVVVPPSLIFNWCHEIEKFAPQLRVAEYIAPGRDLDACLKADVILTTYDIVRRDIEALEAVHFDIAVFDEAQSVKNPKSRRSRAAQRLTRRFTLCLTGTPMENHIGEYHTILNLALPGLLGDYENFQKKIRDGGADVLRRARPFLLRRTKDEILKELPKKQESDLYLDMTREQKEIYTRTVGEVREEVLSAYQDKSRAQAGIVALAALMRLRQTCVSPELLGHTLRKPAPKIEYLTGQLEALIDEGHSVLVFSQFLGALNGIEAALSALDIDPLRLDGGTPVKQRRNIVSTFQNSTRPRVFLISLKAGGVGLNLTNASYVFHVDPWWNPAVENQASDRAHRIGQKKTVFIQRLLMRHSVEEKIMILKNRKKALFESIVDSQSAGKQSGPLISKEDFQFLLSS